MKPTDEDEPESQLCPLCGSVMVTEDGETYCPKCAGEINWGLEGEEGDDESL